MNALRKSRADGDVLRSAIEQRCGCAARFAQTVPVSAPISVDRMWDVVVHVFDLEGCDKANRAYAWERDSIYTALDIGPIRSPHDAVFATIADQIRRSRLAFWGHGTIAA